MTISIDDQLLPSNAEIEDLLVNNAAFEELEGMLDRFNPIRVMSMERMEIRHSKILSWLFDPQESHGLADKFLKAFLSEALKNPDVETTVSALDVARSDLSDANVRCEWRNMDILITSVRNDWVFVIENKFGSKQHSDQLNKYANYAKSAMLVGNNEKIQGIYLSLDGEDPADIGWVAVDYIMIINLLRNIFNKKQLIIDSSVRQFIDHYLEVIQDATGTSEREIKMQELARKLYMENRKVIDFILTHGKRTDFQLAMETLVGEDPKPSDILCIGDKEYLHITKASWVLALVPRSWSTPLSQFSGRWDGCEHYWAGLPLHIRFEIRSEDEGKGTVRFIAELGPLVDHDLRMELVEVIESAAAKDSPKKIGFTKAARREGTKYSRFLKKSSYAVKDVNDAEVIAQQMSKALDDFSGPFDKIGEALNAWSAKKLQEPAVLQDQKP